MKKPVACFIAYLGVSLLLAVAGLSVSPAYAQSKSSKIDLLPLLGKDYDAYEKVLGKPKLVRPKDKNSGECRYYKVAGFTRIVLLKGGMGDKTFDYVSEITFQFPKGSIKDWKTALAKAGFPSDNITPTPHKGYIYLNEKGKKWDGAWIPKNPDSGQDQLEIYFITPADALALKKANNP